MGKFRDLTGQRFGQLTVIERSGSNKHRRATWRCQCDCGRETVVASNDLINGDTRSCGCFRSKLLIERNTTHGLRHTRLYGVWLGMKERCYIPSSIRYQRYGGRGITICDEWRDNFQAFYEWSVSNGYDENSPFGQCTIDRIDNDKGYSPDNCRWVDQKVQRNNRSDSRKDNEK